MKKALLSCFLICAYLTIGSAQKSYFFPTQPGATLYYKYFDANGQPLTDKNKNDRWLKYTVVDFSDLQDSAVIQVFVQGIFTQKSEAAANKQATKEKFNQTITYRNGTMYTDNTRLFADVMRAELSERLSGEDAFKMNVSSVSSQPVILKTGQKIPDEKILNTAFSVKAMGKDINMSFSGETKNKTVESIEDITTPAGTFRCYKIVYNVISTSDIVRKKVQTSRKIDWLFPEIGIIKSETYNDKGKLTENMQLESYSNGLNM